VYRAIQTHYQILALTEELAVDLTKHHAHHDAAPKRVHCPDLFLGEKHAMYAHIDSDLLPPVQKKVDG
jgi:hypothetical protein